MKGVIIHQSIFFKKHPLFMKTTSIIKAIKTLSSFKYNCKGFFAFFNIFFKNIGTNKKKKTTLLQK